MKSLTLFSILVLSLFSYTFSQCSNFSAQWPSTTQSTTSNSLVTATTCAFGGDYGVYSVIDGETYTWTTCGDTDFDTQLTLWDATQTTNLAYNDDDCGLQSTITWTATFTGNVHVLVSEFFCSNNSTCMTVEWACTSCGSGGSGCLNTNSWGSASAPTDNTPVIISTCNYQTEYSTISNVVSGETYEVDSDCGGYATVRSGAYNGSIVASGNAPLSFTASSNNDHYIHWNTNSSCGTATNCCETSITCTSCSTSTPGNGPCGNPQNNDYCSDPAVLTQGGSGWSSSTTTTYSDDAPANTNSLFCGSIENNSWYVFTASSTSETFNFTSVTNCLDGIQAEVFEVTTDVNGCCTSLASMSNCWNPATATSGTVTASGLTVGNEYYLMVDGWAGDACDFTVSGWDATGILPVELIEFDVYNENQTNKLYWTTATEKNNDYFILQYSSDGINWKKIEEIKGAGNVSEKQYYYTTHRDFKKETNYYKLKQVDFNGTVTDHEIISIDNNVDKKLLKRVNLVGQEVNENYKGIVILYYSDGTTEKILQ